MRTARRLTWLLPLLALALLLGCPAVGRAQSAAADFTSAAEYDFGQEMRFFLTAENAAAVDRITLFFRAPEFPNAFSDAVPFTPGAPLAVAHAVDLAQVRLAPFTTVTYWWVLTTTAGADIRVPDQTIRYVDDQFAWRTVSAGDTAVYWTGDDDQLGQLALDVVAEALPPLLQLAPVGDPGALQVYLYPSAADLRAALRLTGRDWVGAHAHPELGVILVTAVNPRTAAADLRQSLPHELMHHLLYQATGPAYDALPAWFNEGLATLAETPPNPTYAAILETAVADDATLPLAALCRAIPAETADALLAYAQSASVVRYVQTQYGRAALADMVRAYADGADCQSGVSRTLGLSLAELDQAWRQSLQPRTPFVQFWLDNGLILLILALGFGLASLLVVAPARS
ncbi:MAG: hypothetical protein KC425_05895 [Anaerolineales bacterium]|nr:hypothetical protein [Anaerolineales bacterium]